MGKATLKKMLVFLTGIFLREALPCYIEYDDLVILGVTFDVKMTFEKKILASIS